MGLSFEKRDVPSFIQDARRAIEQQFKDEERAVFDQGPYELSEECQELGVTSSALSTLSEDDRLNVSASYNQSEESSTPQLSVDPLTCGITCIAPSILENMFKRAAQLITAKCILPVPPSGGKEFIVCSDGKKFEVTIVGKNVLHYKNNPRESNSPANRICNRYR